MSDLGPGRNAPADYVAICRNIADSYPEGISHGLQKDAIQNSLDARKSKKATVHVYFRVVKTRRGNFLTFTDSNTTGLTGDVKSDIEDYKRLGEDDHWARFEAFAFTKADPDALGARGQGKFIFLRASEQYRMFYDTLRDDGVYRLGATEVTTVGRENFPSGEKWEDATAKARLQEHCGLDPLSEVGTRIIVCDPIEEVLEAIRNGEFAGAIQETWFRAIEKKQLKVWIDAFDKRESVNIPDIHPLPNKDSGNNKTWVFQKDFNDPVVTGDFRIKNFHAAYLPESDIPEALQGIAILQGGMKITSRNIDMAPRDVKEKITGFIEFDRELDQELRKGNNQNPNHYDLNWRRSTPSAIKSFIGRQLQDFGHKKLGIGEDRRARQKRTRDNAEQEAMNMLMRYAPDLSLAGGKVRPGPNPPPPSPPPPPSHKKIGVGMSVQFPDEAKKPRVDWGDEIRVTASCFNKTTAGIAGKFALQVLHADTPIEKLTEDVNIDLPSGSTGARIVQINNNEAFVINLDKARYKNAGEYRIHATLINSDSGDKVDTARRKFWLAEDPPRRLPFELIATSLDDNHARWIPNGSVNDSPEIRYNTNHPHYESCQDDEQKHADYLFNICLEGALHFIITRPLGEDEKPDYTPLDTTAIVDADPLNLPGILYEEISLYFAKVRWRIHED